MAPIHYGTAGMANRRRKEHGDGNRLMVTFRPEQREALKELAEQNGLSEAHVVRLIVDDFLERTAGKEIRFRLAVKE